MTNQRQLLTELAHYHFEWQITLSFGKNEGNKEKAIATTKKLIDATSAAVFGKRSKKRLIHYGITSHDFSTITLWIQQPDKDVNLPHLLRKQQEKIRVNGVVINHSNEQERIQALEQVKSLDNQLVCLLGRR